MENKSIMRESYIESEKQLEKKLTKKIKEVGGLCIKLLTNHYTGIPDRICLFNNGKVVFVEVKTTYKKPTRIQLYAHRQLEKSGFKTIVVDSSSKIENLIKEFS